MSREVQVCNLSKVLEFDNNRVVRLVRVLDERLPKNMRAPKGALSIAIMDNAKIAQVHKDFLGDPKPTDVITFEGDGDGKFAGEICASAEMARDVASKYSNTADAELCLYIAHGMLHLAGIDDIEPQDAKQMREAEAIAAKIISSAFRKPVFKFKGYKDA